MEHPPFAAAESLLDAYACCDADLRLTAANETFARLLEQPVASLLGHPAATVAQGSRIGEVWLTALAQVRCSGTSVARVLPSPENNSVLLPPTLEVWPALVDGQVTALLTVVRTALPPQAEAELARQRDQLARVNGHLENFVYTAAHDLQGPVGNLSMLLQLVHEHPAEAEREVLLQHMQESVRQLETTIADLVEVLEVQSTFRVLAHRLNLLEAYAEVQTQLIPELTESGAVLETDFSALPELVYVRSYLHSILRNLLGNAVKYRVPDRPLRIQIRSWREGELAVLAVQDNGMGIDLDAHGHKLFRPFSRLHTKGPGKGIGLHLVQNIVQRNGGHIRVDSQPGQGSTFTCFLREYEL